MFLKNSVKCVCLLGILSASYAKNLNAPNFKSKSDESGIVVSFTSLNGNVVVEGQEVVYKVLVENKSRFRSENIMLNISVNDIFVFSSAQTSSGKYNQKEKKWKIKALDPQGYAELLYRVRVPCNLNLSETTQKPYKSFVKLLSEYDPIITEEITYINSYDPSINFDSTDLFVKITANKTNVVPGEEVVYTISVTNNGPGVARNVIIVDEYPEYLTLLRSSAHQGSYSQGLWKVGDVNVCSNKVELKITARVAISAPEKMKITKVLAYVAMDRGVLDKNLTKDDIEESITVDKPPVENSKELTNIKTINEASLENQLEPKNNTRIETIKKVVSHTAEGSYLNEKNNDIEFNDLITPNGDGVNDQLIVKNIGKCSKDNILKIYNKYGTLVYQNSNYGRDGVFFDGTEYVSDSEKGSNLQEGVYFYVLEYTLCNEKVEKTKKGYFYLKKE